MKQTVVESIIEFCEKQKNNDVSSHRGAYLTIINFCKEQAKEMEEKNLLEMLHKFGFDYTYNYKGEKTIYEWIPEWFEEYKRLEQFKNK